MPRRTGGMTIDQSVINKKH